MAAEAACPAAKRLRADDLLEFEQWVDKDLQELTADALDFDVKHEVIPAPPTIISANLAVLRKLRNIIATWPSQPSHMSTL